MLDGLVKTLAHVFMVSVFVSLQMAFPLVFAHDPWIAWAVIPSVLTLASEPSVSVLRGSLSALFFGWWYDSLCGMPLSVHALTLVVMYSVVRLLSNRIALRQRYALLLVSFFSSLLGLLLIEFLRMIYDPERSFQGFNLGGLLVYRSASSLVTALLCLFTVPLLTRMEQDLQLSTKGIRL